MNGNGEYDGKENPLGDIIDGYRAVYSLLGPEQRLEADVQRALKLMEMCMGPEPVHNDRIHERLVGWFLDYGECRHVEEAFCRYLDQCEEQEGEQEDEPAADRSALFDALWKRVRAEEKKKAASIIFAEAGYAAAE